MHCVIHIGTEKTGTTLIQNWLYENRAALSKQKIFISENLGGRNNRALPAIFAEKLDDLARSQGITTREQKDDFFSGFRDRFGIEVLEARRDHDVFIITSEHFHSRVRRPGDIRALRDFMLCHFQTVRVVCYFREQSDMALSLYSTSLRGDGRLQLGDFLSRISEDNYYYDFKRIADNWSNAFGRDSCDFRIYDRETFEGGDVRRDFSLAAGIRADAPEVSFASASANESLSLVEAAIFRRINAMVPYRKVTGEVNELNMRLKRRVKARSEVRVGKMPREGLHEVWTRFVRSNQEFFRDYFPNHRPFAPPKLLDPEYRAIPSEAVVAAVDSGVDALLGEINRVRREYEGDSVLLFDLAERCEQNGLISAEDVSLLRSIASHATAASLPSGQSRRKKA